ncbi:2-oxo acid dehydrogenase subunit E2 [Mycobacterium sp. SM1]|uniref:dihydrolipoamide acetyltransferase family protein n=1 Tax=Mycobacterium sp. SM1 TaxID=2816243 RepID=UPI001BCD19AD|nr:dihydrolipoamide acetyltransferase family protein [Mycobacterium sp. SM1]MBS4729332.1 2-oxo acid dehydrogenase subunit E2 [Mycobacterium sp. SM1]
MPEVLMPRLSDTMQEGVIGSWLKHQGDPVHKGDVLAEIETDKATMELEAYDEGILTRILVAEGTTVPIGTPIAVIDSTMGAPGAAAETPSAPAAPGAPTAPRSAPPAAPPPGPAPADTAVRATPLVRRLAREHGIDLATITGSGPEGRIIRADIDKAIAAASAAQPAARPAPVTPPAQAGPDTEEIPLTRVRRLTAQRLAESARQAPHFYLTRVVHADALLAFRSQINAELAATGIKVSVTDLLVKACAQALITHPEVNSSWGETRLLRHRRVHIGVAVAVADGLIVPVLHDADRKTLSQLSREAHALAERARSGRLSLEEISGATFTISNLGMYGVDQFTAVINPPQAAILAVGAATESPIVRDGRLTVGTTLALTLAIDHRVLDGATGAQFLADLTTLLQHPTRIVL